MLEIHKALKSGSITTKRAVLNLGVLGAVSWITLVIKSKSPPIKGAVLESGLIIKSVCSVTKRSTIKRAYAFKIKTTAIKGGIIGSVKLFIKSECPPFHFTPPKVAFSSKVKLPFALLKAVLVALVVPLKK